MKQFVLVSVSAMLCAWLSGAGAAYAGFRVCNQNTQKLAVAFAQSWQDGWRAAGWYVVEPGNCLQILDESESVGGNRYFLRIEYSDGAEYHLIPTPRNEGTESEGVPVGTEAYLCVDPSDAFTSFWSASSDGLQCNEGQESALFNTVIDVPNLVFDDWHDLHPVAGYDFNFDGESPEEYVMSGTMSWQDEPYSGPSIAEPDYLEWDDRINPWD